MLEMFEKGWHFLDTRVGTGAFSHACGNSEACKPQKAEVGSRVYIEVDCRRQSLERMGVNVGSLFVYAGILECV